jgi:prepilin-type N-terminal cleavage/methylation domain-containing protein
MELRRSQSSLAGFTLIEILIVVVILGILAAIIVPQFNNASQQTNDASVERALQIIRHQVEYYRAVTLSEPNLISTQWDDLIQNDYLHSVPINPQNLSTKIAAAPAIGVGWVWRDNGYGVLNMYATDVTFLAEYPE